jgi:beta-lactamase superfamily II metal-dependent hydrolase
MTTRKTKTAKKRTARKTTKSAAKRGSSSGLRVRMYRVGFGDFFLVTVPTSKGDQYILIDCGVFKGTSGTGDIGSIVEAVEDMYQTTNGKLALVIMTHRHADHIAGFSKAKRFQDFTAKMVWMPYWEQFNDDAKKTSAKMAQLTGDEEDPNEAHNLLLDIHDLATNLALQFRGRDDADAKEALAQLGNATGIEDFNAAAAGRKKGGSNAVALDLLKNHLGNNGKNVRYYAAGDKAELPDELDGLKATILGPPPKKAKAFLNLMDLKKGVGQYLDSLEDGEGGPKAIQPFPKEWNANEKKDYPKEDLRKFPIDYKQAIENVNGSQPDMLAAAAGKIENFLNNQSLVVLFEFEGKKLLFAGDAQGGNWEYWLFKTEGPVKDPTKAGDVIEASKELLQTIDFYKVGHHGSTNATPIQAVEAAIARPKSSKGFVSMCSTEDDVYGNKDKETEVPRVPLMKVLKDGSCLLRSDAIPISFTDADSQKTVTIKARKGVTLPKPKTGKVRAAKLYLEYTF